MGARIQFFYSAESLGLMMAVMVFSGEGDGYSETDLRGLIESMRAGNRRAEEDLLRWVLERVTLVVKHKVAENDVDWKDVRQECCLEIWRALKAGKHDPKKGSVPAFIAGIVRIQILSYFSRKKEQKGKTVAWDFTDAGQAPSIDVPAMERLGSLAAEVDVVENERQERLRHCLEQLPLQQREVIMAIFYRGERQAAIATALEKKKAQDIAELNRQAKKRLRKCMDLYNRP